MVRKRKKDKDPYLPLSGLIEKFDFIEEVYPDVEVNPELLPITLTQLTGAAEPFTGSDLGDCLQILCRFLEDLEHRKSLEKEEIVEAYLAKEEARCYIRQGKSHWEETDHSRWHKFDQERLESLGRAREMAQRACDQADSYYRQMRGKQILSQTDGFYRALKERITERTMKL